MKVQMSNTKMVPGELDINGQIGRNGEWAGVAINESKLKFYLLIKRWKFYHPVPRNFEGSLNELKLRTYPGSGYLADRPWLTFLSPYNYELNFFLDLYPKLYDFHDSTNE